MHYTLTIAMLKLIQNNVNRDRQLSYT